MSITYEEIKREKSRLLEQYEREITSLYRHKAIDVSVKYLKIFPTHLLRLGGDYESDNWWEINNKPVKNKNCHPLLKSFVQSITDNKFTSHRDHWIELNMRFRTPACELKVSIWDYLHNDFVIVGKTYVFLPKIKEWRKQSNLEERVNSSTIAKETRTAIESLGYFETGRERIYNYLVEQSKAGL